MNINIKPNNKEETQALRWLQTAINTKKYHRSEAMKSIRVKNGQVMATDGHRLHIAPTPESFQDQEGKNLIPDNKITATPRIEEFTATEDKFPDVDSILESVEKKIEEKGIALKIGIDKNFLADLKQMPGDNTLIFTFVSPKDPIKVTNSKGDSMAVIMPVFIKDMK